MTGEDPQDRAADPETGAHEVTVRTDGTERAAAETTTAPTAESERAAHPRRWRRLVRHGRIAGGIRVSTVVLTLVFLCVLWVYLSVRPAPAPPPGAPPEPTPTTTEQYPTTPSPTETAEPTTEPTEVSATDTEDPEERRDDTDPAERTGEPADPRETDASEDGGAAAEGTPGAAPAT